MRGAGSCGSDTSKRLRPIGKPFGTGLLGSRCHDRASSLACQTQPNKEYGSMKSTHEKDNQDISLLAFDPYMRAVKSFAPPDAQAEERLLALVFQGRHEQARAVPDAQVLAVAYQARDRLVEGYQRLVISLARKYQCSCRSMELLDLIQEGNLGLLKALACHEPGEGRVFVSFACRCIHQALIAALHERERLVRLPKQVARELAWMRQEQRQLADYLGTEPTAAQGAQQMGGSVGRVWALRPCGVRRQVSSLEEMLGEEASEEGVNFVSLFEQTVQADQSRQVELSQ